MKIGLVEGTLAKGLRSIARHAPGCPDGPPFREGACPPGINCANMDICRRRAALKSVPGACVTAEWSD